MPEAPEDSDKRDWDLPPMDADDPAPGGRTAPDRTFPLDRPADEEITDDSERRDWDLP